jgi:hypothetical protein
MATVCTRHIGDSRSPGGVALCKYVDNYTYKNANHRHVQSNWEEVELLAVISDGRHPQEADEQKFKAAAFIAVGY